MALKDWNKIRKDAWENIKNQNQIWVTGFGLNYIEKYAFLTSTGFPRKPLIKREFKTKSQAIRFAKRYMSKH